MKEPLPERHHPLHNLVIMEHILQQDNWDFQDLKNFRCVCRFWRDVTMARWRSTATLCIAQQEGCSEGYSEKVGVPVTEFLSRFHDPEHDTLHLAEVPFSRYRLCNFLDTSMVEESLVNVCTILNKLIEYLHLDNCKLAKPGWLTFARIVFEVTPSLTTLAYTNLWFDGDRTCGLIPSHLKENLPPAKIHTLERYGHCPFRRSFEEFLLKCPGLTTVKQENRPNSDFPFTCWRDNRAMPAIKHFDRFEGTSFSRSGALHDFKRANLPLETLSVKMDTNDTEFVVPILLKGREDSLRVFKAIRTPPIIAPFLNFPCEIQMNAMKELHLWGNVTGSFQFLRWMPNLSIVHISTSCFTNANEMDDEFLYYATHHSYRQTGSGDMVTRTLEQGDMSGIIMPHLTQLHLDAELSVQSLRVLAGWAPHLKRLEAVLNNETLSVVCEEWPQLKELVLLFGSDVDDAGVTGIVDASADSRRAGVTHLKYLRRFASHAYCDEGRLTDFSVSHGFLLLPHLHTLHISVSPSLSWEAEERLEGGICQVHVIRNYGVGPHGDCCLRKLFRRAQLKA